MEDDVRWIRSYVLAETGRNASGRSASTGVEPRGDPGARAGGRPPGRRDRRGRRHGRRPARPAAGGGLVRRRRETRACSILVAALVLVAARARDRRAAGGVARGEECHGAVPRPRQGRWTRATPCAVADLNGMTCIRRAGGVGRDGRAHAQPGPARRDDRRDRCPRRSSTSRRATASLKLVALEYLVFGAAWAAAGQSPPSLFGQEFELTRRATATAFRPFYALHAWIWNSNPSGLFSPYNPSVSC